MVSKNNFHNKMEQDARRVPHYGLRKLSLGVASVLLSTTLYFGVSANASTVVSTNNQPETVQNGDTSHSTPVLVQHSENELGGGN